MLGSLLRALSFSSAVSHAILYTPEPRSNIIREISQGKKLRPLADARNIANQGCGGADNDDPGVEIPEVAYRPGETITVQWKLTIPHPADVLTYGIRIAVHYGPGDSFAENVRLAPHHYESRLTDATPSQIARS